MPFRPIAGKGSSADQLSVDLKELSIKNVPLSALTDDQILKAGRVIFYDDMLNSGIQSTCRLSSWFDRKELCEHHSDVDPSGALALKLREAILSVPVTFMFYAKHPTGEGKLWATCKQLGLSIHDVIGVINSSLPSYTLEGFKAASPQSKDRFVQYLTAVGKQLLAPRISKKRGWDEARVQSSALGFSGIPLTIVFRHAISTSTPVALWELGDNGVEPWLPVFPRHPARLRKALGIERPIPSIDDDVDEYEGG